MNLKSILKKKTEREAVIVVENEEKKDELQDISGCSELTDDDEKILEIAIDIIAMYDICTKGE